MAGNLATFLCRLLRSSPFSTSCNSKDLFRSVVGQIYHYVSFCSYLTVSRNFVRKKTIMVVCVDVLGDAVHFRIIYQRQIKRNGKWGVRKFAENLEEISQFQATLGWYEFSFRRLRKSGDTIWNPVVRATWRSGFVHPCCKPHVSFRLVPLSQYTKLLSVISFTMFRFLLFSSYYTALEVWRNVSSIYITGSFWVACKCRIS